MIILSPHISSKQLEWRNDPKIYAWTRQNGLLSPSDHEKWLARIQSDPTIKMFGIESDYGLEVGTCGLTSINPTHGTAEFSLFIAPEHHKKGYGKPALQKLLSYGFKHMRLNCIFGETFEGNHAKNMFLSIGMIEEGKLQSRYFKHGQYINTFMVSITHDQAKEQSWY